MVFSGLSSLPHPPRRSQISEPAAAVTNFGIKTRAPPIINRAREPNSGTSRLLRLRRRRECRRRFFFPSSPSISGRIPYVVAESRHVPTAGATRGCSHGVCIIQRGMCHNRLRRVKLIWTLTAILLLLLNTRRPTGFVPLCF